MKQIAKLCSTFFYIGLIEFAPGTVASVCALAIGFALKFNITILFFITCFFLFIGIIFAELYTAEQDVKDPKEIVIDEIVGMFLTLIICLSCARIIGIYFSGFESYMIKHPIYLNFIFPFVALVLFRFFDITKPSIIGNIDRKTKNSVDVMLDDILAAIFSGITFFVVIIFLYKSKILFS